MTYVEKKTIYPNLITNLTHFSIKSLNKETIISKKTKIIHCE